MLKVQATAWLSDNTSASTPSLLISSRIRFSFSDSISPENCMPWMATRPSGGSGRSVHTWSSGLDSHAISSGPRLAQGAARGFGCRRGGQPGVKTGAVTGRKVPAEPVFRRRIDQRLDMPSLAVDLLGGLQRVAAFDEHGGLLGQHPGKTGRTG